MSTRSAPTLIAASAVAALVATTLVATSASAAPTTFIVDTLSDNPADGLTLREAIDDANSNAGADTIEFTNGLTGTITLTAGELESTDDLTIVGPGPDASDLTIDGDGASRVLLSSTAGISLSLDGLTIANGQVIGSGGGVAFGGGGENLTIKDVAFNNNAASGQGGGLWVANPGSPIVDISGATFDSNRAGNAGGGLYLADAAGTGEFDLSGNLFIGNESVTSNGGGAFITAPARDVFVRDSLFSNNAATTANAGGLWADGGQVMVTDSTLSGNTAGSSFGGATINANATDAIVRDTIFESNVAMDSGAGNVSAPGNVELDGVVVRDHTSPGTAGLQVTAFGDLDVYRSTFFDNDGDFIAALQVSGPMNFTIRESTFEKNDGGIGGAVSVSGVGLTLVERSTFFQNTADPVAGQGGALRSSGGVNVEVDNSTFTENTAFDGGAIYGAGGTAIDLDHVTIVDNTATGEGGGVYVGPGGNIDMWNSIVSDNTAPSFPDVNDATLDIEHSILGDSGGIVLNGTNYLVGIDPDLGPLRDNGGPTQTMMPELASPAIDSGMDRPIIPAGYSDQRGWVRSGIDPDMGAVEVFNDHNQIWVPTTPARFVDTRATGATVDDQNEANGAFVAGEERKIPFAGRGDVPADAVGVVANITAVSPGGNGFITAHACVAPRPNAASLNYTARVNLGNEIILGLDNGEACIYSSGDTQITVDVVGYISPWSRYQAVEPARYADTRANGVTFDGQSQAGGTPGADMQLTVDVAGRGDVPANAKTVAMYVAAISPGGNGFVTVWDCATNRPLASSLNHVAGVNRGNEVIAQVSADGEVCFYTSADVHLTVDVVGYVAAVTNFSALDTPSRLLDTRASGITADGQSQAGGIVAAGDEVELIVAGRVGIPGLATTATVNITAVNPSAAGFITVYDCVSQPLASSLNYVPGVNGGNEIIAEVNANGRMCLFTSAATHLTADITGYTSL